MLSITQNRIFGITSFTCIKMSKFQQQKNSEISKNLNMHSSQKRLEIEQNGRNLGSQAL